MQDILNKIVNMNVSAINLGHGSFITIDFGNLITETVRTKRGERTHTFGEWHLWVYMCGWRIDKDNKPLVSSSDSRDKIAANLSVIADTKLTKYEILNSALDTVFCFGHNITLTLFNTSTEDEEQWFLYTPDQNVLVVGPADRWHYGSSKEV